MRRWKETYNLSFEDVLDLAYGGVHLSCISATVESNIEFNCSINASAEILQVETDLYTTSPFRLKKCDVPCGRLEIEH